MLLWFEIATSPVTGNLLSLRELSFACISDVGGREKEVASFSSPHAKLIHLILGYAGRGVLVGVTLTTSLWKVYRRSHSAL
jgi:hypothetical protein